MKSAVHILPALMDNYLYGLTQGDRALVIDPGETTPVMRWLKQERLTLDRILITHTHWDHVDGVLDLKQATGCRVFGPDDAGVPGLDEPLHDGEVVSFGDLSFRVLATPGHGRSDISYIMDEREPPALFCGDTLFVGGCGRILQGSAALLWASLQKLAALPEDTAVYCGHEYTRDNLAFAQHVSGATTVDPEVEAVLDRIQKNQPSVPSSIGWEKRHNPFLRVESLDAFTQLRKHKDSF